jgi:hypothetical protein
MTELDLAGEQRLDRGGAAADVDQTGFQAVLFEDVLFLGQPKRADTRREGAIGSSNLGGGQLYFGLNWVCRVVGQPKNYSHPEASAELRESSIGFVLKLFERSDHAGRGENLLPLDCSQKTISSQTYEPATEACRVCLWLIFWL